MISEIGPIRAEERLEAITDQTVASGAAKRWFISAHHRHLMRQAGRREVEPATAADLQAMGIQVIRG